MAQSDITLQLTKINRAELTTMKALNINDLLTLSSELSQKYKNDKNNLKTWKQQIDQMADSPGKTTRLEKYNERLLQFREGIRSYKTVVRVWM